MVAHIIAMIGFFIGLLFTFTIAIRIPHIGKPGVKIVLPQMFWAAFGWTVFVAAMWIF
jgi:hypothetical protein